MQIPAVDSMVRGLNPLVIPMSVTCPISCEDVTTSLVTTPSVRRILLIDDDPMLRRVISIYLRSQGHIVDLMSDASCALSRIADEGHDLVITYIFMPNCDGLEAIRKIRARHPAIGIIAISGGDFCGTNFLRAAQLMGATCILPKPFELSSLGKAIARLSA